MRMLIVSLLLTVNGLLMAADSAGQDLSRLKVSVDLRNVTLRDALKKIEASADVSFSFRTEDIAEYRNISLSLTNIAVDKLLEQLLRRTNLRYEVIHSNIVLTRNKEDLLSQTSQAVEDGVVKGVITDQKGEPIASATVMVMETKRGTPADETGHFTISGLAAGTYTLRISAVGYTEQTRVITVVDDQLTALAFRLAASATSDLTEVTVTALGIRREKRELGYSAQEVKGDLLTASHQSNIVNALQGQAAGLQINSGGGAPGQGAKIILRGINSLDPNRPFQPLFVIDGVPIDNSTDVSDNSELEGMSNRAGDINPDDIESINVLKGGAATALYGLRASTGAIIITTKSGKSGKLRGSFTSTGSIDEIDMYPHTQRLYTQGTHGEYDSTSFWPAWGPTIAEAKAIDHTHPDALFNNYEHAYRQGGSYRNSLNLSGGTDKAIFTGSFSQFNQTGVMPFTDYKNYSVKVGGQFKFSDKVKFGTSINYIKSGGHHQTADRYNENLTYYSPRWDVWDYKNADGTQNTIEGSGNDNPLYIISQEQYVDDVDRIISNSNFTYSPFKWLDVNYRFGADIYNDNRHSSAPGVLGLPDEIYPASDFGYGYVGEYHATNTVLNSTLMLNFHNKIGKHIESSFKIGHDLYSTEREANSVEGDTLIVPMFYNLSNTKRILGSNRRTDYRIMGVFGDWTLGYDNFLYLTLTGRNDFTSTLRKENRSFFYPSASISWVFTENITPISWLSFGKLRFSAARVGKDALPYALSEGYNIGVRRADPSDPTGPLDNGVSPFNLDPSTGDVNLKPEFTTSYEGGIEAKFLNNRLGLDLTLYDNTSKDLIIPVKVPVTSGLDQVYLNAGSVRNKGIEVSVSGSVIQTKDFNLDLRANFTHNENKVLSIYPGLQEIVASSQFGYSSSTVTQKYIPGLPVGALFGRTFQRYYGDKPENEGVLEKDLPWVIGENGFPVLNPASKQQYIANSEPKWIGSFSANLRYKNFGLYFLFDAQQGVYRYNQFANFLSAFGLQKGSLNRNETVVFPGVHEDGTPNTKPVWLGQGDRIEGTDTVAYSDGYYRNYYRGNSEFFIENASWIRLRTISLSYSVPAAIMQRTHFLNGATITLSGTNLWINTKWSTFDPESSSTSSGSVADGFSGFTYPATKSYLLSVNLNF